MYNQTEVQQIINYVVFPLNKEQLLQILYANKFSVEICNAIEEASFETFKSMQDIVYALNHYNPSIL